MCGVVAAATAWVGFTGPAGGAPTPAGPLDDADRAVEEARQAADRAATAYFEQLSRYESLGVQIADTQRRLDELRVERDGLRRTVARRAALAYRRSGSTDLDVTFAQESDALSAARRTELLERLNEEDNDAAEELNRLTDDLYAQRTRLEEDRRAQEQTLALLQEEQAALDARLAEAQAVRNAVAAQIQAEAAARASAAAAARAEAGPAPAPPADYAPTPGEHPQHNHPFLVCTRGIESGGNYEAYNPAGPYLGAYQFLQSTWNSTANHAGRFELVGVDPRNASHYDQDDMAWVLYNWQGSAPWGGRCD